MFSIVIVIWVYFDNGLKKFVIWVLILMIGFFGYVILDVKKGFVNSVFIIFLYLKSE